MALTLDEAKQKSDRQQVGHQVHYAYPNGVHVSGLVVGVFHPGDSFGESCFHFGTALVENRIRGHNVNRHRRASFIVEGGTGVGSEKGRINKEEEEKQRGPRASNLTRLARRDQRTSDADGSLERQSLATGAAREFEKLKQTRRASTGALVKRNKTLAQIRAEKAAEKATETSGSGQVSSPAHLSQSLHPLDHEKHFNAPPPPLPKQSRRAASVVALEHSQLLKVTLRDYTICMHQHQRCVSPLNLLLVSLLMIMTPPLSNLVSPTPSPRRISTNCDTFVVS